MSTSRRKQLHPKSLKGKHRKQSRLFLILFYDTEEDALLFVLPDELKYDAEVSLKKKKSSSYFISLVKYYNNSNES
jgi:hypothetical protein